LKSSSTAADAARQRRHRDVGDALEVARADVGAVERGEGAVDLDVVPFGKQLEVVRRGVAAETRERDAEVLDRLVANPVVVAGVEDDGVDPPLDLGDPGGVGVGMVVERLGDHAPFGHVQPEGRAQHRDPLRRR
jgi:hypothetical protein